jgi:hypothetical protein
VAVNVLAMSEVVVDPKGAVRSQPFKHYLARRKHDADRHSPDTARLPVRRNISNQRQDSEEFLGRKRTSQQAHIFKNTKFTISDMVTGQQLMVLNEPLP